MTAIELKTSIMSDLDQMNTEMLASVSQYVKRLRHSRRNAEREQADVASRREAAMAFVKTLSVLGGQQIPTDERGMEALITMITPRKTSIINR